MKTSLLASLLLITGCSAAPKQTSTLQQICYKAEDAPQDAEVCEFVKVDKDGNFSLVVPKYGNYHLKLMAQK